MRSCGYSASITQRDTSVMLIDCGRMASVWTLEQAQHLRRLRIEARARAKGDFWGALEREWNARDDEYAAGRSKVLHYTTIHTQPWQPFPELYVYQPNPVGHVWLDMEQAADREGYQLFDADHPSARYQQLIDRLRPPRSARQTARVLPVAISSDSVEELLVDVDAATVLDYHLAAHGTTVDVLAERAGRTVTRCNPVDIDVAALPERGFDAVVCRATLEYLPEPDIAWSIELLFRCARRCVHLSINTDPDPKRFGAQTPLPVVPRAQQWWLTEIERASARYPDVHWKLVLRGEGSALVREGGRRTDGALPTIWVLEDHKPGHTTQSVGLASALGFPYEIKRLRFNTLNHFSNRVRGASTLGLSPTRSAALAPPWPDLVISTGRRSAPVARWIGEQSGGRTRMVQLGRRGGESVDAFDLVVACAHFRLPLHPRRMQIVAPLNAVTPERMAQAAERWHGLFGDAPRPHIVLVAGGTCARHRLDAETARRMGNEVRAWAESLGGSVFAITSRRTGPEATAALRSALGEAGHLHEWRPGEVDNPYMGHLALADAIIVTGESESMLAEAAAAAKPLFIYPLPERPLGFRRIAEWIAARAESRPRKAKGTVRPQQGLEYLCARLIAAGVVRPPRHLDRLHDGLVGAGAARYFGVPLDAAACRPLRDVEAVARRVRLLLGFAEAPVTLRAADQVAAATASPAAFVRKQREAAAGTERSRRSTAA
jgi:mitochondrial fission protein ELM1